MQFIPEKDVVISRYLGLTTIGGQKMVDFGALRGRERKAAPVNPRTLYGLLPNKEFGRGNLWDAQAQVLSEWHELRADRDIVIKLNTGGGKTAVGLVAFERGAGPTRLDLSHGVSFVECLLELRELPG
jgi:hypothetical protein